MNINFNIEYFIIFLLPLMYFDLANFVAFFVDDKPM